MAEQRLIDAYALSRRIVAEENEIITDNAHAIGLHNGLTLAQSMVINAPTIDAVVLLCKVGDLVYALWSVPTNYKYVIYCAEVKEIRIAMRNCRLTTTYFLEPIAYRGHRKEYRDDDFGNLVFPTEEEAEAALAERKDDGK